MLVVAVAVVVCAKDDNDDIVVVVASFSFSCSSCRVIDVVNGVLVDTMVLKSNSSKVVDSGVYCINGGIAEEATDAGEG